jgi:CheY-like chemotaxis protein
MSHEIRTPINGVVGIANLLMEEDLTRRQKEYVRTLNFSAQHLATVVSDILDFSKIESGHMVFEKVSFNLEKNCQYVFNLFANKAAEKNIAFNFIPAHLKAYSLYGDYVRLNQVLSNLLSNAIKFTDKGSVDFSYSIDEDSGDKVKVSFRVKDTGIGIPEENQKQIFDSFTQADETITRQYGGTGLGLTISKKLVEMQGGTISLTSARGKGSEFVVQMLFDKHVYKKDAMPVITTAEKNQNKDLNGMKILVAEDNNINAMVLTRFLTKWNIESKVAQDGSEALKMLETETFDIILMDIQMPNVDGIEATKIIRQSKNENLKNIMVVAFTADASVDNHRELLKIGFDHCMTKPFNPETLFAFLKKNYNAA